MTPKRTATSLALEAAALAYAAALEAYRVEGAAVTADHLAATGSHYGSHATPDADARLRPLREALAVAEGRMGRAAVALWKAERRRSGGGGRASK
mgnify:CR=1 FL=1